MDLFYVETKSGRFRRASNSEYHVLPVVNSNAPQESHDTVSLKGSLERMTAISYVAFLGLQGIIAGATIQNAYECNSRTNQEFLTGYAHRANENRRFSFMTISLCLTGSFCLIQRRNEFADCATDVKVDLSPCVLTALYFVALSVTLVSSVVDDHISKAAFEEDIDSVLNEVDTWKVLAVTRSTLCVLGWLVSCYQVFQRTRISKMTVDVS